MDVKTKAEELVKNGVPPYEAIERANEIVSANRKIKAGIYPSEIANAINQFALR